MADAQESIGEATMTEEGVIVLRLRAESDDGAVGQGYFEYSPNDPGYTAVIDHLGGLVAGESKPVLPWPDNDER